MNTRIKELIKQADIKFDQDINDIDVCALLPSDLEKFAELIVTECLDIICDQAQVYTNNLAAIEALTLTSTQIKDRFGVKE